MSLAPQPPPLQGHDQQTLLPADICIEALVQAGGNTHLAAERLFGQNPNATAWLVASIAQDPLAQDTLNAQLRTLTTLQAFDSLNSAKALLDVVLTDLDPEDFTKFYSALLAQIAQLTAPSTTARSLDASQLAELLMSRMPPHVRRRFLELVEGPPDPSDASPPNGPEPLEGPWPETLSG